MKRLLFALILLSACRNETALVSTDTREPIDMAYVTGPELKVYAQANENSPVIATYQNSEGVSILEKHGDWVQIRVGDRAGWARAANLGSGADAQQQAKNPTARFRSSPAAVTQVSARGEIYLEADVNTDGDVVAVRILSNTTGNPGLAAQNAAALQAAKFYPIVQRGERKPFKYYHRVSY